MTKLFLTTGPVGGPREIIAGPFDKVTDALQASALLGQRYTVEHVVMPLTVDETWKADR